MQLRTPSSPTNECTMLGSHSRAGNVNWILDTKSKHWPHFKIKLPGYFRIDMKVSLLQTIAIVMFNSIQFHSKSLSKDGGDPVSLKLIFPGVIQTWKQIQQLYIHIYKTKQVHQKITGKHNLHVHTKHKHSYLT